MYHSILVPVDGSETSEYAIPFALEIARHTGGEVRLLHVVPFLPADEDVPDSAHAAAVERAELEMRRLETDYPKSFHRVSCQIRFGSPFEEILAAAGACDLVVLSTHGRGGVARWVLGSTADKVIRLCPRPVVALRPPDPPRRDRAEAAAARMFRDMAVALDGSPLAEKALDELRQFSPMETKLHFVRVVAWHAGPAEIGEAQDYLKSVGSSFVARGVDVSAFVEKSDNVAEEIAAFALRHQCGLIALGTHGTSGLTRWILGSVADKVVRHGPAPVLMVRRGRPVWKEPGSRRATRVLGVGSRPSF